MTPEQAQRFKELYEKYPMLKVQGNDAKPVVKRFELVDQRPSGFVKKNTEGTKAEQRLKAPSEYELLPEATVLLEGGESLVVRFIPGAKTIIKEEQELLNLTYSRATSSIVLKHGGKAVANDFLNANEFTYLSVMGGNVDSPLRAKSFDGVIYEFQPSKIAELNIDEAKLRRQAEDIVFDLYKKRNDETIYDETMILMLCNMFSVSSESMAGRVQALLLEAQKHPELFIESVGSVDSIYRANVRDAVQLSVLSIDGDKATRLSTNTPFYTFDAKKKDAKESELIKYFLSPQGTGAYQTMMIELEGVKAKALVQVEA